ncbi:MAG: hypothetical protein QXE81_04705 [Desulfurococcaceae archaeon]
MQRKIEALNKLEEAVLLIDKIESVIYSVKPGNQVQAGTIYRLYEAITLLREKIVETRLIILQEPEN